MSQDPRTFVLIPGASHGGWVWRPVAEHLREAGHHVFTPTLPGLADDDDRRGLTLADAVDFIVSYIEEKDLNDIVLVAHSWGGYPVTGAAPRVAARLARLVYYSAFVPAEGKSMLDEIAPETIDQLTQLAAASPDNSVLMSFEAWQAAFIQDATEAVQRLTYNLLVPQPFDYGSAAVAPLEPESFGVPIAYLLGSQDYSLPPTDFAGRLGLRATAVPGSHEALFTRPDELAQAFLEAV
jgi:pimeloyl-ACP methyl ester carboxylesterase